MQNIAFICGAPRSGTTLLTNLLDGHPDIFMLPMETRILQYWYFHKNNNSLERFFSRDYLNTADVALFISKIAKKDHAKYVNSVYGVKDYFNFKLINRDDFIKQYKSTIKGNGPDITLKSVYEALFNALMQSEKDKEKLVIEKRPLDNEICAILLHKAFPNAKFVHIIRDPRTRYVSAKMRRVYRKLGIFPKWANRINGKDFSTAHAEISMVSMELARFNKEIIGEKYHIVKYEELLKNPEKEIKKIAHHLCVEYTYTLLQQTSGNKEQVAMSSIERGMPSGIRDNIDTRLKEFFIQTSRLERMIIYYFTWEISKYFEYYTEPVESFRLRDILHPLKYENPKDYLKNRMYMLHNLRGNSWTIKNKYFHDVLNKFDQGIPTQD